MIGEFKRVYFKNVTRPNNNGYHRATIANSNLCLTLFVDHLHHDYNAQVDFTVVKVTEEVPEVNSVRAVVVGNGSEIILMENKLFPDEPPRCRKCLRESLGLKT